MKRVGRGVKLLTEDAIDTNILSERPKQRSDVQYCAREGATGFSRGMLGQSSYVCQSLRDFAKARRHGTDIVDDVLDPRLASFRLEISRERFFLRVYTCRPRSAEPATILLAALVHSFR